MLQETPGDKTKKTVDPTDWFDKMNAINIPKPQLNKLIMNFFVVEGYKDAAEKFQKESGTDISNLDLSSMQDRIDIRSLIHKGDIDAAIQRVNEISPDILKNNEELMFNLQLQKVIEYIKENKVDTALEFARKELMPLVDKNPKYLENIEKVMTLLAYDDISKSPMCEMVENSQRIKISSELNFELLKRNSTETDCKLPIILKLMLWSQSKLQEKVNFPVIKNIATAEFAFKVSGGTGFTAPTSGSTGPTNLR